MMSATIQTHELIEYWTGVADDNPFIYNTSESDEGDHGPISSSHGCSKPAEIFIPGRTFPVQEFFLEDILSMTGFVDKEELSSSHEMDRIEAEMAALLKGSADTDSSKLACVICGQTRFTCPEELGAHVAFCDGGGKNPYELEKKIRMIESPVITLTNPKRCKVNISLPRDEISPINPSIHSVEDIDIDDDPGLIMGKWDGESPFAVADTLARTQTTLTEEELLRRYQLSHDDDEIDDLLIVEVIKLIHRSSYGDGAILIFLPGKFHIRFYAFSS
jgi:hypothetical protein